jgi:hypothetical protein
MCSKEILELLGHRGYIKISSFQVALEAIKMLRNLLICGSTAILSLSHSDEQYSLMLEALIRKRKWLR